MIAWSLLFPTAAAILAGAAAAVVQRRLRPPLAALLLSLLCALVALAVLGVAALLAAVFVAQFPVVAERLAWCAAVVEHHEMPTWLGGGALAGTLAMVSSVLVHLGRLRRRHEPTTGSPLVVLPTDRPTAYAVPGRPGRPGHIVVSAGMLRVLDAPERRVLLAHEWSHLRRGHHRYLWVAGISAAAFPALRPLRKRVRFAVERWADEDAAAEVGDRRLVARAIFRASLAESGPAPALALAGLGVRARVEALLVRPNPASGLHRIALAGGLAAVGVGVAGSTVQFHHLLTFAGHVCPT